MPLSRELDGTPALVWDATADPRSQGKPQRAARGPGLPVRCEIVRLRLLVRDVHPETEDCPADCAAQDGVTARGRAETHLHSSDGRARNGDWRDRRRQREGERVSGDRSYDALE